MSETPRFRTRMYRPAAVKTWEVHQTGRSSTLFVHRTDGGKVELHYAGHDFEVPDNLVEAFGLAIAEAVAWKDEPDDGA